MQAVPPIRDEPQTARPGTGVGRDDVNLRGVVGFGIGLAATGVVVGALVWLLLGVLGRTTAENYPREFPLAPTGTFRLPPEPRLQVKPREDLKRMRAEEDAILNSYGWVDPSAGVVRIPIQQAMKKLVEEGLPARQPQAESPARALPRSGGSTGVREPRRP